MQTWQTICFSSRSPRHHVMDPEILEWPKSSWQSNWSVKKVTITFLWCDVELHRLLWHPLSLCSPLWGGLLLLLLCRGLCLSLGFRIWIARTSLLFGFSGCGLLRHEGPAVMWWSRTRIKVYKSNWGSIGGIKIQTQWKPKIRGPVFGPLFFQIWWW